jgi:TAG lipase / steryl ester hydrolase / phospholipase A2 / LPA acyltransferase
MSVLRDSTIASQCHDSEHTALPPPPRRPLRKAISVPAVSSIVRDSWNWAGKTIHTYRDGLSAEERKNRADREDRKQVLYLKIKNVSGP